MHGVSFRGRTDRRIILPSSLGEAEESAPLDSGFTSVV